MKMHGPGLAAAVHLQAERQQLVVGPGPGRFEVHQPRWRKGLCSGLQRGLEHTGLERRIKQHQMHAAGAQAPQRAQAVAALDPHHVGFQTGFQGLQRGHQGGVLFAQQYVGRAA
jgi:hypothetical protein